MPNWATNDLIVSGDEAAIEEFQLLAAGGDDEDGLCLLDFNQHSPAAPAPKGEKDPSDSKLIGRQVAAWGTKWRLAHGEVRVKGSAADGQVTYSFSSAWSPPVNWLARVGALHDELSFELIWAEPGMGFAGQVLWDHGELVREEEYERDEAVAFITGKDRRAWLVWDEEEDEEPEGYESPESVSDDSPGQDEVSTDA